jgi:hypothetical protein
LARKLLLIRAILVMDGRLGPSQQQPEVTNVSPLEDGATARKLTFIVEGGVPYKKMT